MLAVTKNETPTLATSRMMTRDEVAELIGCSVRSLYRMVSRGDIPSPVKVGALARWRRDVIARWLAAGCPPESSN